MTRLMGFQRGAPRWLRVFAATAAWPALAAATTIHVPSPQPTIQAGIDASSNGDTVVVADGTYTGAGNRNLRFNGRSIVLMSANGASVCTIDAQNMARGLVIVLTETPDHRAQGVSSTHGR